MHIYLVAFLLYLIFKVVFLLVQDNDEDSEELDEEVEGDDSDNSDEEEESEHDVDSENSSEHRDGVFLLPFIHTHTLYFFHSLCQLHFSLLMLYWNGTFKEYDT